MPTPSLLPASVTRSLYRSSETFPVTFFVPAPMGFVRFSLNYNYLVSLKKVKEKL